VAAPRVADSALGTVLVQQAILPLHAEPQGLAALELSGALVVARAGVAAHLLVAAPRRQAVDVVIATQRLGAPVGVEIAPLVARALLGALTHVEAAVVGSADAPRVAVRDVEAPLRLDALPVDAEAAARAVGVDVALDVEHADTRLLVAYVVVGARLACVAAVPAAPSVAGPSLVAVIGAEARVPLGALSVDTLPRAGAVRVLDAGAIGYADSRLRVAHLPLGAALFAVAAVCAAPLVTASPGVAVVGTQAGVPLGTLPVHTRTIPGAVRVDEAVDLGHAHLRLGMALLAVGTGLILVAAVRAPPLVTSPSVVAVLGSEARAALGALSVDTLPGSGAVRVVGADRLVDADLRLRVARLSVGAGLAFIAAVRAAPLVAATPLVAVGGLDAGVPLGTRAVHAMPSPRAVRVDEAVGLRHADVRLGMTGLSVGAGLTLATAVRAGLLVTGASGVAVGRPEARVPLGALSVHAVPRTGAVGVIGADRIDDADVRLRVARLSVGADLAGTAALLAAPLVAASPDVAVVGTQAGISLGAEPVHALPSPRAVRVDEAVCLGHADIRLWMALLAVGAGLAGIAEVRAASLVAGASVVAVGGSEARVPLGALPVYALPGAGAVRVFVADRVDEADGRLGMASLPGGADLAGIAAVRAAPLVTAAPLVAVVGTEAGVPLGAQPAHALPRTRAVRVDEAVDLGHADIVLRMALLLGRARLIAVAAVHAGRLVARASLVAVGRSEARIPLGALPVHTLPGAGAVRVLDADLIGDADGRLRVAFLAVGAGLVGIAAVRTAPLVAAAPLVAVVGTQTRDPFGTCAAHALTISRAVRIDEAVGLGHADARLRVARLPGRAGLAGVTRVGAVSLVAGASLVAVCRSEARVSLGALSVHALPGAGAVGVVEADRLVHADRRGRMTDLVVGAGLAGVAAIPAPAFVAGASFVAVGRAEARVPFGAASVDAAPGTRAVGVVVTLELGDAHARLLRALLSSGAGLAVVAQVRAVPLVA